MARWIRWGQVCHVGTEGRGNRRHALRGWRNYLDFPSFWSSFSFLPTTSDMGHCNRSAGIQSVSTTTCQHCMITFTCNSNLQIYLHVFGKKKLFLKKIQFFIIFLKFGERNISAAWLWVGCSQSLLIPAVKVQPELKAYNLFSPSLKTSHTPTVHVGGGRHTFLYMTVK